MNISLLQSVLLWAIGVLIVTIPIVLWLVPPPFFTSVTVDITRGTSVAEAADKLAESGVVYTPELVTLPFKATGNNIPAGTYQFSTKENAVTVVSRLAEGDYGISQNSVVIPEGFTNQQIADRLQNKLKSENFSSEAFLRLAEEHQGYLYPDSYQFYTDVTAEEVIQIMRENFDKQISSLKDELSNFDKSLADVIKMASLVELEAADYQIRRRIAGVLWNRIEANMPLQVDAVFMPLIGKGTSELTKSDLEIESPYNLYINTGLPPTPIANPGLESIRATVKPVSSEDLYYLSDSEGNFYFAETLAKHNLNKQKYLR